MSTTFTSENYRELVGSLAAIPDAAERAERLTEAVEQLGDFSGLRQLLEAGVIQRRTDDAVLEIDALLAEGEDRELEDADDGLERRIADEMQRERARREARRRLDAELRATDDLPEISTLRQRLARPRPATAWRLPGWQPADSRVILSGAFKSGKTHLVGNLVRSLVDGDAWLGIEPEPITGSVAILDLEMSERQLDEWLEVQRIRNDDRVIPVPLRGKLAALDLLDDHARERWAGWLREREVHYLVLDCLRPLMDSLGLDENHDGGRVLVAFDHLLAEAKITEALVVHHMGHVAERSRGDSRLRDWPDVEWRLMREDAEDPASPRYLAGYGRDVDQPEQRVAYDNDSRRMTLVGGSRKDAKHEDTLRLILDVIHGAAEPLSGRAIKLAVAEDASKNAVDGALKYGHRKGLIKPQDGPRNSKLWSSSVPSVPECPVSVPGTPRVSVPVSL